MGLSRRTTAPSMHPLDMGCLRFRLSREFACLSREGWPCGPCGVCISGQVSGAGEWPVLRKLKPHLVPLTRHLGRAPHTKWEPRSWGGVGKTEASFGATLKARQRQRDAGCPGWKEAAALGVSMSMRLKLFCGPGQSKQWFGKRW